MYQLDNRPERDLLLNGTASARNEVVSPTALSVSALVTRTAARGADADAELAIGSLQIRLDGPRRGAETGCDRAGQGLRYESHDLWLSQREARAPQYCRTAAWALLGQRKKRGGSWHEPRIDKRWRGADTL
jgi:hypothetical protein